MDRGAPVNQILSSRLLPDALKTDPRPEVILSRVLAGLGHIGLHQQRLKQADAAETDVRRNAKDGYKARLVRVAVDVCRRKVPTIG